MQARRTGRVPEDAVAPPITHARHRRYQVITPGAAMDEAGPAVAAAAAAAAEAGERLRWALDTTAWRPSPQQLRYLGGLLPPGELADVMRYLRLEDRKRAMASRVMQRACVAALSGSPGAWREVQIRRTERGKPFAAGGFARPIHAPNFNFNVAHEVRGRGRAACRRRLLRACYAAVLCPKRRQRRRWVGGAPALAHMIVRANADMWQTRLDAPWGCDRALHALSLCAGRLCRAGFRAAVPVRRGRGGAPPDRAAAGNAAAHAATAARHRGKAGATDCRHSLFRAH